jgi:lipopolysaccharide export system permease protein
MTIVDRYLLMLFLKIFLVCFLSFTGLFIVIHLFSNLDELAALSKEEGWPQLMGNFYGPRAAEVFDKTSAVWTLVAAVFAVSLMQRRREMTAIEAAGITKSRILRSIWLCALVIVGLSIAAREFVIPKVKDQLVRTPQNWSDQENISMGVYHDLDTGIRIRGTNLSLLERKINDPDAQLTLEISQEIPRITALWATAEPADETHPAGLLFQGIVKPENIEIYRSLSLEDRIVVYLPGDQNWLEPSQCFVACDFDPYEAAYGNKLTEYQSLPEMLQELRKPRLWFGNGQQIKVHSRILQPVLDLTLLLLGLPLIITRAEKNVFVSAGLCFLIVGALQLTTIVSHSLGSYNIIQPAVLAAWLPVIVFLPFAVVAVYRIDG